MINSFWYLNYLKYLNETKQIRKHLNKNYIFDIYIFISYTLDRTEMSNIFLSLFFQESGPDFFFPSLDVWTTWLSTFKFAGGFHWKKPSWVQTVYELKGKKRKEEKTNKNIITVCSRVQYLNVFKHLENKWKYF